MGGERENTSETKIHMDERKHTQNRLNQHSLLRPEQHFKEGKNLFIHVCVSLLCTVEEIPEPDQRRVNAPASLISALHPVDK